MCEQAIQAYGGLEELENAQVEPRVEEPKVPDFLLEHNWYEALFFSDRNITLLAKDPHKELNGVLELVNFFSGYFQIPSHLVDEKLSDLYSALSDVLIPLLYIGGLFYNNDGNKAPLTVIEETTQQLVHIYTTKNLVVRQSLGLSL